MKQHTRCSKWEAQFTLCLPISLRVERRPHLAGRKVIGNRIGRSPTLSVPWVSVSTSRHIFRLQPVLCYTAGHAFSTCWSLCATLPLAFGPYARSSEPHSPRVRSSERFQELPRRREPNAALCARHLALLKFLLFILLRLISSFFFF